MRASVAVKSILSGPEQQLYGRLVRAFPGHVILAHVALPRFLIGDGALGAEGEPAPSRIRRLVADFVICCPDFSPLAVVELAHPVRPHGARRDRHRQKDRFLQSAGIKVLRVDPGDIPGEGALRALVAGLPARASAPPMRRAS